ncbi:MAG: DUF3187 family protein [Steroidobacteraceae bacterium]
MARSRIVGLVALAACVPAAALAEPLVTMNQNPLVLPYGLPLPLPARLPASGHGRYGLDVNWSNTATIEGSGSYDATVDAETVDVRLRLEHSFGERWAVMAEIPWRSIGGGSLDGSIEGWHDFWGMPNGDRDQLPKDQYLIEVQKDGQSLLYLDRTGSGIADIPIRGGYQLVADEKNALAAWLTVDLPTGDPDYLLGSGATDVAVSIAGQSQLAEHWQVFGQFDLAWLGSGDVMPGYQQDLVVAGLAGVSWNAWRALDLTVQLYANSKVFDVPVNGVSGDAVVLGFGGTWRTGGGWRFDFGMNEDVDVGASPDATFYLLLQKNF